MALDLGLDSLRRTPVALALIVVNVAVYLALTAAPGLEEVLGLPAGWDAVADRPWAPVTVIFTAGSLLHLAGAVAFVLVFARELERLAGGMHLLAVYVLAGVAGSLASQRSPRPRGWGHRSERRRGSSGCSVPLPCCPARSVLSASPSCR